ncbi:MAG: RT0821/Lpp0805 family surface protein [Sphingomonadales bacterium]
MSGNVSLKATTALALALTLGACAEGNNQGFATLLGAGIGALIGSEIGGRDGGAVLAVAGGIIGAAAGSAIGARLDEADRLEYERARFYSLQNTQPGQTTRWYNPDSGNRGSFTPGREYTGQKGVYCREFTQSVIIGGKEEEAYGKACLQPDGSWLIVPG